MIPRRTTAVSFLALCSAMAPLHAQTAPWTAALRGSWVQTQAPAQGDVTLAAAGAMCQIVVGDDENTAVRQAAEFLSGDIEKISGRKPAVVSNPSGGVSIRLVTL